MRSLAVGEGVGAVGGEAVSGVQTTTGPTTIRCLVSLAASSAAGSQTRCARKKNTMTRDEIAKKAQALKDEINETGTPMTVSGGIKLLNQCKRVMADMCVLIRDLAREDNPRS